MARGAGAAGALGIGEGSAARESSPVRLVPQRPPGALVSAEAALGKAGLAATGASVEGFRAHVSGRLTWDDPFRRMGGMSRYPGKPMEAAYACISLVECADADTLHAWLQAIGQPAWIAWERENREEIVQFLCATPAKRLARKAWQDPAHRARLALSTLHVARLASGLLEHIEHGVQGLAWTAATGLAAWTVLDLLDDCRRRQWPWEGEPPFPEWEQWRW